MRDLLIKKRANTTIEFTLLICVVILAIIGMQAHLKRGIEGGWRRQIEQMAGQFSFDHGNISTTVSESTSRIEVQSNGVNEVRISQDIIRITDEEIEPLDAELQIRI